MKYIVMLSFLLINCTSSTKQDIATKEELVVEKPDRLSESINSFIQKYAHDPSSYQPIENIPYDTIRSEGVPCSYEFIHSCRLKNQMGGLVKQEYYVQTDLEFNVINMVSERKKRLNTPCERIQYLKAHPSEKI